MGSLLDSDDFNARLFFPRPDASKPPEGARDLTVAVDGAVLHARWHREASPLPVVLMFHGNGEVVADYDDLAQRFAASLVVVDYRGYGQSTGKPTLRSLLADAPLVLEAIQRQAGKRPLFVVGRSLGSACAIELYGRSPGGVTGFVLDSGWSQLDGLVRRRGLTARLSPEDRQTFEPLPKLAAGRAPLLVVHGEADALISATEGRELFEAAGTTEKAFEGLAGLGHNDLFSSERYWAVVGAFLSRRS